MPEITWSLKSSLLGNGKINTDVGEQNNQWSSVSLKIYRHSKYEN